VVNASPTTIRNTSSRRSANDTITIRPPARYNPTFSGASFSAARPIDLIPPMITAQVSTATTTPVTHVGIPNTLSCATAIEFGCVNGVVVSAATPATTA
jgi:hypothetical protein